MIKGWHFCDGWKLLDGTPLEVGRTYHVDPPLGMCRRGLHGSERLIDALRYAYGTTLCRVEFPGSFARETDRLVATDRRVVAAGDATKVLHLFACDVAECVLMLTDVNDNRCWEALEAKRAWVRGEIDDRAVARSARAAARADSSRIPRVFDCSSMAVTCAARAAMAGARSDERAEANYISWYAAMYSSWCVARYVADLAADLAGEVAGAVEDQNECLESYAFDLLNCE